MCEESVLSLASREIKTAAVVRMATHFRNSTYKVFCKFIYVNIQLKYIHNANLLNTYFMNTQFVKYVIKINPFLQMDLLPGMFTTTE